MWKFISFLNIHIHVSSLEEVSFESVIIALLNVIFFSAIRYNDKKKRFYVLVKLMMSDINVVIIYTKHLTIYNNNTKKKKKNNFNL